MRVQAGAITCRFLFAAATAALALFAQTAAVRASGDRTLSLYHIHTKETLTVLYKKNGRFVPEAMKQINWILRDWRKNQATQMDPNTIDIIWEMHRELGSEQPVHIISGYRSPATNEMLRKTRGGQAKQSQHMTGKAIDISFPDVPIRRMRYSAMVRERGGVGYYPTSGIPFVHVDTGRVRHWPRMLHDELALLFPSGRSKHQSASGRSITPADVRTARERRKDLVQEVTAFYALRDGARTGPIMVADASGQTAAAAAAPSLPPPRPVAVRRPPAPQPHQRMAVGAPLPEATPPARLTSVAALPPAAKPAVSDARRPMTAALATEAAPPHPIAPPPRLVAAPRPVERPSQFVAKLPDADRSRLDMLVQLAALDARETAAAPAVTPAALVTGSTRMQASLMPALPLPARKPVTAAAPVVPAASAIAPEAHFFGAETDWRSGWITAPEYDDDHPDELSYRPFALAPLLTETSSFDDPALAVMVHPDAQQALDMIDDEGVLLPMRFGAGHLQTAMVWAQEFKGDAVHLEALAATPAVRPAPDSRLVARAVRTEAR